MFNRLGGSILGVFMAEDGAGERASALADLSHVAVGTCPVADPSPSLLGPRGPQPGPCRGRTAVSACLSVSVRRCSLGLARDARDRGTWEGPTVHPAGTWGRPTVRRQSPALMGRGKPRLPPRAPGPPPGPRSGFTGLAPQKPCTHWAAQPLGPLPPPHSRFPCHRALPLPVVTQAERLPPTGRFAGPRASAARPWPRRPHPPPGAATLPAGQRSPAP